MISTPSNRIMDIAHSAAKIPFVKALLKPLYYNLYKKPLAKKRKKTFRENAKDVLRKMDRALRSNGYQYTLTFGTLLGAIRNNGFMSHDCDIDIAMWGTDFSDNVAKCLAQEGFKLLHLFEVDGSKKGREETYEQDGVSIDIFYFFEDEKQIPFTCLYAMQEGCSTFTKCMRDYGFITPIRFELPISKNVRETDFEGISLPIPLNAEEFLTKCYGTDYMIPNPKWKPSIHEYRYMWYDAKATYQEFHD